MPGQATNKIEEAPICGICGDLMVWKRGKYKCEICEYFFGASSRINTCSRCRGKFGRYKVVEERFLSKFHLTEEGRKELNHRLCPRCRRESHYFNKIRETLVEKIKYELEQENFTHYQLASLIRDLTDKNDEFIRYCQGDVESLFIVIPVGSQRIGHRFDLLNAEVYKCAICGRLIGRFEGKLPEPGTNKMCHSECAREAGFYPRLER